MQLLDDALERIKPYIIERINAPDGCNPDGIHYRGPDDYGYFKGDRNDATVGRLRLDWELSTQILEEETGLEEAVTRLMLNTFKEDLEDLIINGDVTNYKDALLTAFDGAKKRGTEPKMVDIFSAQLHWERRETRVEYTLYILLAVKWA